MEYNGGIENGSVVWNGHFQRRLSNEAHAASTGPCHTTWLAPERASGSSVFLMRDVSRR